jgi:CobQ-like glutamine amidotransferase family enzyme
MIASVKNAERYRRLIARALMWRDAPLTPDATTKAITRLATLVHACDEETTDELWALGECEINLADLLIGAYVFYAENHHGQWSLSYAALSALGKVVDGVDSLEPDSTEEMVYDALVLLSMPADLGGV